jgi:hypothetical protein
MFGETSIFSDKTRRRWEITEQARATAVGQHIAAAVGQHGAPAIGQLGPTTVGQYRPAGGGSQALLRRGLQAAANVQRTGRPGLRSAAERVHAWQG